MADLLIESGSMKPDLWFGEINRNTQFLSVSIEYEIININQDQAIEIIEHLKKQFNLYGN